MATTHKLSTLCKHYAPYYDVSPATLAQWFNTRGYSMSDCLTKAQARRILAFYPKPFISPKKRK